MSKVISIHPPKKRSYLDVLDQFRIKRAQAAGAEPNTYHTVYNNETTVIQMHPVISAGWDFFRNELEFE